ncbi:hypothetical protein Tco_1390484 [Tanacetum coccineum]
MERVSSGLTDVVVALSAGEKGDGSLPSSADDEEATSNPSRDDGAAHSKSESVFVQGNSHVLVDAAKVTMVGLERVSSGLIDVVMALSPGEKGDGSLPSSAVDEEAAANPFRV